jgi:Uma2 family endonuclease
MIAARKLPDHMSTAEFFLWEGDGTTARYELVNGALVAMAPATGTHSRIQANMARLIGNRLDGSRCSVMTEAGLVPRMASEDNVRVPDLAVTCSPDVPGLRDIPDPILVVEILSPGNKHKTWANVWAYASVPTIKDIVILSSWSIEAQVLSRDSAGNWPDRATVLGAGDALALPSIDLALPLAAAYAKTYLVPQA